jgi:ferredoxin
VRVEVAQDKCISVGNCVRLAPEVFDQRDEDGVAMVVEEEPGADSVPAVRDAVRNCPVHAIVLRAGAKE